ncbi:class I SAM-dependent methyltransferase [Tritonibacter mobilis]|uniref:class I SAM-dependent methyltransferase n=1 Tax=Tritonibacter mobilis TaxID=379347 RepID=UPI000806EB7B|nr:class I SAM-dependent methyltransferase [Tritonibacter mobilis]MBU3032779.1 class I SAM-dependent methyltransferase [Tritonibacter mobilis]WHQ81969.1 class I SAM-dependent methyltransferase [Tritonibacter mobilis]
MSQRLSLAVHSGDFAVPETGRIAVFLPREGHDLSALPQGQLEVIQPLKPENDYWTARGLTCVAEAEAGATYAAAVVFIPRAKPLARQLVAQAVAATQGPVLIDGVKTDGIDSLLKELKKRTTPSAATSKAHGKAFCIEGGLDLSDWILGSQEVSGGFVTEPGVFSADGIDPASALLAQALPAKLGKEIADLGAGWGYLSAQILGRDTVATLHLVEADHIALTCARRNVDDARAQFHWADARQWGVKGSLDAVVMNPPFHTGRAAEPALGQAFIANAARLLKPAGQLWLVANRHLPYETPLNEAFASLTEVAGDNRFKILHASRPRRSR